MLEIISPRLLPVNIKISKIAGGNPVKFLHPRSASGGGAASPEGAGQIRVPEEIPVHLRGGGAPLGDGPHHQGLAPAHIAGGKHLLHAGGIAARRGADSYACALEELGDTVSGGETPEQQVAAKELADSIGQFLWTLPPQTRHVFLWRYYYFDDIRAIANRSGMSRAKVKSLLYRTRQQLKTHLVREGFL